MTKQIKITDADHTDIHILKRNRGDRSVAETFSHIFLKFKETQAAQGVTSDA